MEDEVDGTRKRKRWVPFFRFRLRTLLIVFTILGAFVGPELNYLVQQHRAAKHLRSLPSTSLGYDYDLESSPEWKDKFPPIRSSFSGFVRSVTGSVFFSPVVRLFLSDDSNESINSVGKLGNLKWLQIAKSNGSLSEREIVPLKPIENCSQLEYLVVGNWLLLTPNGSLGFRGTGSTLLPYDITASDIRVIGSLDQLRVLAIGGQFVTDESLKDLSHLTSLEYLYLSKTKVTPDGVSQFKELLPNVQVFELNDPDKEYSVEVDSRF